MKRKKKSSIGCLFWIALILLLVVIFLLSRARIETVLETTGFKDIVSGKKATESPVVVIKDQPEKTEKTKNPVKQPEEKDTPPEVNITIEEKQQSNANNSENTVSEKKSRKATLYFILVEENGSISLKPVTRTVYFSDSPLTQTMLSLIHGLTPSELNRGLISLIPEGTSLLGISIKDSTAFINFSEQLKFNSFGEEGLEASLKQIVFTATEFPTVKKVQILINGKAVKYLSTEGVFAGEPLSRASFK